MLMSDPGMHRLVMPCRQGDVENVAQAWPRLKHATTPQHSSLPI